MNVLALDQRSSSFWRDMSTFWQYYIIILSLLDFSHFYQTDFDVSPFWMVAVLTARSSDSHCFDFFCSHCCQYPSCPSHLDFSSLKVFRNFKIMNRVHFRLAEPSIVAWKEYSYIPVILFIQQLPVQNMGRFWLQFQWKKAAWLICSIQKMCHTPSAANS